METITKTAKEFKKILDKHFKDKYALDKSMENEDVFVFKSKKGQLIIVIDADIDPNDKIMISFASYVNTAEHQRIFLSKKKKFDNIQELLIIQNLQYFLNDNTPNLQEVERIL